MADTGQNNIDRGTVSNYDKGFNDRLVNPNYSPEKFPVDPMITGRLCVLGRAYELVTNIENQQAHSDSAKNRGYNYYAQSADRAA